ncbi:MAG: carbohydrate binding domain-containing protein [Anaerolineae bacterium]
MKTWVCIISLMVMIGSLLVLAGCHQLAQDTPPPAVPPLFVADFDRCQATNNLGGEMGPASNPPDSLIETYIEEAGRGCVARLDYEITGWAAFWLKLQGADLRSYQALRFDVRADAQIGIPDQMKVELKRSQGTEIALIYVADIEVDWKTVRIDLASFRPTGTNPRLATWEGMEDLVFVFESAKSGGEGRVYLDNIAFER